MAPHSIHHITAIAGPAQRVVDFHAGTLGLRLVKRTVNFDDPGTWHFYFGDAAGSPGTILTHFPWAGVPRGRHGSGEVSATTFAAAGDDLSAWQDRLRTAGVAVAREQRFGREVITFEDADGARLEIVGTEGTPSPAEPTLTGFAGATLTLARPAKTVALLERFFGYKRVAEEGDRLRLSAGSNAPGDTLDIVAAPEVGPSRLGAGIVHHIALRSTDPEEHVALRERLQSAGHSVSPVMDRSYFRSIYFREPGGIIFEVATDGPGFATDETPADLGGRLTLPPWLEPRRAEIESILPAVNFPVTGGVM